MVLILGIVGLTGCTMTRPGLIKKFDQTKISQIKEGETTRAEVEQLLGPPMWCQMNPLTQKITLGYFGVVDVHVDRPIHEEVAEVAEMGKMGIGAAIRGAISGVIQTVLPIPGPIPVDQIATMFLPKSPKSEPFKSQTVSVTIGVDGKVTNITKQLRQSTAKGGVFQPEIQGTKIDFAKVAQIHEGETTTAELEKLLGVPQLITEESHEVTWEYQWNWRKGEQRQNENVEVTFDPQGKVKKLTKDSYRGTTRFYGDASVPLDRNNLLKIQVGKTTREEIEHLLGQPTWESTEEREAMTQTRVTYRRLSKKGQPPCFELITFMLDANGVVKGIEERGAVK